VAVNEYWQPIKTWTVVALAISQNGLALSTLAIAALIALLFFGWYLRQREKASLINLLEKLPKL